MSTERYKLLLALLNIKCESSQKWHYMKHQISEVQLIVYYIYHGKLQSIIPINKCRFFSPQKKPIFTIIF